MALLDRESQAYREMAAKYEEKVNDGNSLHREVQKSRHILFSGHLLNRPIGGHSKLPIQY